MRLLPDSLVQAFDAMETLSLLVVAEALGCAGVCQGRELHRRGRHMGAVQTWWTALGQPDWHWLQKQVRPCDLHVQLLLLLTHANCVWLHALL